MKAQEEPGMKTNIRPISQLKEQVGRSDKPEMLLFQDDGPNFHALRNVRDLHCYRENGLCPICPAVLGT